ncbi:MAG: hypothetical protein RMM07_11955, partial [Anaerolineae bacterium]|nr:hypothetical protein [Anaerolineae bacterium]
NGQNGWWTVPPTVDFRCEDETSGVAFCTHPVTVTTEGITTVPGIAEDGAGWRTTISVPLRVDLRAPLAGLLLPASWCFPCSGPVGIGMLMEDTASGVNTWLLRLESPGGMHELTGNGPAERVFWDGRLGNRQVSPGEGITVTLVVTDVAGWTGAAQAFLVAFEPPPPSFQLPIFPPAPTKTPSPTPTRPRSVPTRTPTPEPVSMDEPTTPAPVATGIPMPTPTPSLRVAQVPPAARTATILGVIFLDRNGNGVQDPGEPGVMGAVLEVMGRRITTGPDGRFYLPTNVRAAPVFSVRGRLTVADGVGFGVQPYARPWWLLGLALGMMLLGITWALDPRQGRSGAGRRCWAPCGPGSSSLPMEALLCACETRSIKTSGPRAGAVPRAGGRGGGFR